MAKDEDCISPETCGVCHDCQKRKTDCHCDDEESPSNKSACAHCGGPTQREVKIPGLPSRSSPAVIVARCLEWEDGKRLCYECLDKIMKKHGVKWVDPKSITKEFVIEIEKAVGHEV